jgi:hypothetical protein
LRGYRRGDFGCKSAVPSLTFRVELCNQPGVLMIGFFGEFDLKAVVIAVVAGTLPLA